MRATGWGELLPAAGREAKAEGSRVREALVTLRDLCHSI
jgi:hypothetical protein